LLRAVTKTLPPTRTVATMRLPSGRRLYYYKPFIEPNGRFGPEIRYHGPRGVSSLTKPIIVENLVQATARDLIAIALLRLEARGFYTVAHVHDSVYVECRECDAEQTKNMVTSTLEVLPHWAKGLPVETESEISRTMK